MTDDPNPPRTEDTDAALAEQMQLVAEGRHPVIARIVAERDCIRTYLWDGTVKTRKVALPGRNEPCYCGSHRKYKHCCLR